MTATFLTRRITGAMGALMLTAAVLAAAPASAEPAGDPTAPTAPEVTAGTNGLVAWTQYYRDGATSRTTSSLRASNGDTYFHPIDSLNTRPDHPEFAPGGGRLAYSVYGGALDAHGIWVVSNPFGHWSNLIRLTDSQSDSDPTWSPDGKQVAFIRTQSGDNGIWVIDADGGAPVQLLRDSSFYGEDLTWSPDGTKIAYADYSGSPFSSPLHIYVLDLDTGTPVDLGLGVSPSWSPNGNKIAFQFQFSAGDGDIYWMNPDGTGRAALNSSGINNWEPSWSPDGTKLVYLAPAGVSSIDVNTLAQAGIASGSDLGSTTWGPAPSSCLGREVTIGGTPGDDQLRGSRGVDVINGLGGNDTITGLQGQDVICGGPGDDTVSYLGQSAPATAYVGETDPGSGVSDLIAGDVENLAGGTGADRLTAPRLIRGGGGPDVITAGSLFSTLYGGPGDDRLVGGTWADVMFGEGGDDVLIGDEGDDLMHGGNGDDVLNGGEGVDDMDGAAGDDEIRGGPGADVLKGGTDEDALNGGADNDSMDGGLDADLLIGGSGNDTVDYSARTIAVTVTIGADGSDDGSREDGPVGERDTVRGSVENLRGGSGSDVLIGNGVGNQLTGNLGVDELRGGDGRDLLRANDGVRDRVIDCGGDADAAALVDNLDPVPISCS